MEEEIKKKITNQEFDIRIDFQEDFADILEIQKLKNQMQEFDLSLIESKHPIRYIDGIEDFFPNISITLSSEVTKTIILGVISKALYDGIKYMLLSIYRKTKNMNFYRYSHKTKTKVNPNIHLVVGEVHVILPFELKEDEMLEYITQVFEDIRNLEVGDIKYFKYDFKEKNNKIYNSDELVMESYRQYKRRNTVIDKIEEFVSVGKNLKKEQEENKRRSSANGVLNLSGHMPSSMHEWMSSIKIFISRNLSDHPLASDINEVIFHSKNDIRDYEKMMGLLKALLQDSDLRNININKEKSEIEKRSIRVNNELQRKEYDVFISHANSDKNDYVNELYLMIKKLGIKIFYDSEELSWGDNWKEVILNGVEKSEFAIIVISESFFGREWTERELAEFLQRQNESNQKIILPLLHNITLEQFKEQYSDLKFIQSITTNNFSPEEVSILLAKELIKRYKNK